MTPRAKRRLAVACGLVVLICASSCGRSRQVPAGGSDAAKEATAATTAARPGSQPAAQDTRPYASPIESIALSPMDPTRASTLTATVKTNPAALPGDMRLSYILWVNAAIVLNGAENKFPLSVYKKNDLLYVDAVLSQGEREVFRRRSPMIRILNTSPEIQGVDLPDITGPGTYAIKVRALDADGDPLAYALEGDGVPEGAAVDADGVISLTLAEPIPESIVFSAVVRDNDQGECRQEIKIAVARAKKGEQQ